MNEYESYKRFKFYEINHQKLEELPYLYLNLIANSSSLMIQPQIDRDLDSNSQYSRESTGDHIVLRKTFFFDHNRDTSKRSPTHITHVPN